MEILKDDEFNLKIKNSKGMAVVDFFATWCGPCQMLGPVFESVSKDEKMQNVKFYKIDVDKSKKLAEDYNVKSVPTIILFKDGNQIDVHKGYIGENELIRFINKK